jgi:hypothetical protein
MNTHVAPVKTVLYQINACLLRHENVCGSKIITRFRVGKWVFIALIAERALSNEEPKPS